MSVAATPPPSRYKDSPTAWLILAVGVFTYFSAVAQRTSFGVATVEAADRFHTAASELSLFSMMQVLVYALLQVPVGVLVDRFGPRILITVGAVAMVAGQLQLAAAQSVAEGVVGRILVGAGDAATFVCVMRLLPVWFSPLKVPMLSQVVGMTGNLGQLFSVIPFAALLHALGWVPSFAVMAGIALVAALLSGLLLRSNPPGVRVLGDSLSLASIRTSMGLALREPGTQLGFWVHFTVQFVGNTFALTWAYPYLQNAQGLDPTRASAVMTCYVVFNVAVAPLIGRLSARFARRRSRLVLACCFVSWSGWAVLLIWPGHAPTAVVYVAVCMIALSLPASMIAFDIVRAFNPPQRGGTATGLANVGGFAASLLAIYVTGLVLDLLHGAGISRSLYDGDAFRPAIAAQGLVALAGTVAILRCTAKVRRAHGADAV
ncbi:MFS transporter [Kocuria tytonis]|uniref:MFS transporter n=1 Tax=Kocuria tytonis TaxID=2054280 RepID=A0A495AA04_9MICC|nr:MFS transporter [Kocuria tytonis]RKQ36270.1 MFS transporter [Kocuria tytonis]